MTNNNNSVLPSNDLYTLMRERHSVRHFDTEFVISEEEINEMIELAVKAPSSSNSQSWRFLVVTDKELKKQLKIVADNQQQVEDASAVFVILSDMKFYDKLDEIFTSAVEAGYMPKEFKDEYVPNVTKYYQALPKEQFHESVSFDAGLVAMQLMLIAKSKGYDTVPMGGYNKEKLKMLLNVPDNLLPLIILPIGKGIQPGRRSTRLPVEDVLTWNQFK
ncbi:nitroreductase family protein [Paenibacillus camerounensis]|uniref:nitroreductase family protein n=1 Tax=Paenibacillus camerounensis TaxID=1243663 RepID=UPI0005A9BEB5|nr:nitroreductase family protein [Paenibacillus camerounensis]